MMQATEKSITESRIAQNDEMVERMIELSMRERFLRIQIQMTRHMRIRTEKDGIDK